MQLIGMLDSPYVRRVAISLKRLGIPFKHRSLSVFQNFDDFSQTNPLVKAPTLVCDDGTVLLDSTLILEYIETMAGPDKSLMPSGNPQHQQSLRLIGLALGACEKTVQIVYERTLRPAEKQYQPWLDRVNGQLVAAYDLLEQSAAQRSPWLVTTELMQPDITVCVAWRFTQLMLPEVIEKATYPALAEFSNDAERLPEFVATPLE
ncbi:glutathione S-transferase [Romeria aff. gracilis LEGE 07310]|uniref:Glutathione S-transferase n=1 Tax=Vasconcelosia minhoensis LEGE 07310 TaxID=915328 RepID=A0A8J7AW59_9CYAN|nr:glutathione S-transferase [Romeria gracilis]MBE9078198.1 glutathione S-transferase [Romeria aff. gracilis LEGE 07310]